METTQRYELFLNHITAIESFRYPHSFEVYKKDASDMLQYTGQFWFEDDLIEKFKGDETVKSVQKDEPLTIQHLLTAMPDAFVSKGEKRKKNKDDKEPTPIWYNVWDIFYVTPDDGLYYDLFFTYKIRCLDLLEVDDFLNYQLEIWYENNSKKFFRFLQLTVRKHEKLLPVEYIQTVNEWMAGKEKEPTLEGTEKPSVKTKSKLKRESADNLTMLNQEQTALLIHYLQKAKIFLKDEFLNNKQAGEAMAILTGYSADTLRQTLGMAELERIKNKKNLTDIYNAFARVSTVIENELREKKKSA